MPSAFLSCKATQIEGGANTCHLSGGEEANKFVAMVSLLWVLIQYSLFLMGGITDCHTEGMGTER